jgi:type II secretory pathway component GspD/PulD (secretin)
MARSTLLTVCGLAMCIGLSALAGRAADGDKPPAKGDDAAKNKRLVYLVRYGSAKDLATALAKHFKNDAEVQAVTETGSNYLLISAPPTAFDEVVKTLELLDRAPRTISVDVWVAEVVPKKGEYGKPVEDDKGIDEKDLAGSIEEVQKKVEELAKNGRIAGLKHVQLSALENQAASILTGENKPYVVGRMVTARGIASNQVSYRNIGATVRVTPRITADKSLLLELAVEDARMSMPEDGISLGVSDKGDPINATEFTTTKLDSKLTVASGKAVAAEGLKSTSKGKQAHVIILVGARVVDGDAKGAKP